MVDVAFASLVSLAILDCDDHGFHESSQESLQDVVVVALIPMGCSLLGRSRGLPKAGRQIGNQEWSYGKSACSLRPPGDCRCMPAESY